MVHGNWPVGRDLLIRRYFTLTAPFIHPTVNVKWLLSPFYGLTLFFEHSMETFCMMPWFYLMFCDHQVLRDQNARTIGILLNEVQLSGLIRQCGLHSMSKHYYKELLLPRDLSYRWRRESNWEIFEDDF